MREILFRGKRLQGGDWVEGYFYKSDINKRERESGKATLIFTPDCDTFMFIPEAHNSVMVIAETVGQYTGLCDRNGKKIFEGDIIKYSLRDINEKAIIKYGAPKERYTMYGWYLDDNHGNTAFLLSEYFIEFYDCVVIGNIYDNPEQIGGNK